MIRMRDICVSFRRERQEKIFGVSRTQVLFDVSLSIPKGSCLGILGESGSGKSTLGRVICGLLKPDSGDYLLEGKNVYASRDGKKNLQNMLSVVFQDYTTSANPRFRIRDILAEGIRVKERKSGKRTDRSAEYCRLLELVGLDETFLDRFPHELSGGQLQRVCIARAVACEPEFILFDEADLIPRRAHAGAGDGSLKGAEGETGADVCVYHPRPYISHISLRRSHVLI